MIFTQNRQPISNYLFIPRVSSEKRKYIPIGFLSPDVIASDSAVLVCDADEYIFGIICSNVHNFWVRNVAGRLETRYRYAPSVYYNFPFPKLNEGNKKAIIKTAKAILSAREKYSHKSLADMYGEEMYLYPELEEAHQANDRAVMAAYGFPASITEAGCVAELFKLYREMVEQ